jgi:aerobic carbon-monoxide dehydrogenase medium subunit
VKPAPFRYARPGTLAEAIALLGASPGETKLLAGGQSLLPLLNMRLVRPAVLVDLALVAELQVLAREGDELVIGAGITQRTAETSALVRDACALVPHALRHVGHLATRTRGTIGGSLAHADPRAQLPGVAVALDARLVAVGPRGRRVIAAGDFFAGPHETALHHDEVLTEVRLPVLAGTRCAFREAGRRSSASAAVGVAAAVRIADEGRVAEARFAATGVGPTPLRLSSAEELARGSGLGQADRVAIAEAGISDAQDADPTSRARVVGALLSRALGEVA